MLTKEAVVHSTGSEVDVENFVSLFTEEAAFYYAGSEVEDDSPNASYGPPSATRN
jgi:hypothetical protein